MDTNEEKITNYTLLKRQGPNLIGLGSKTSAKWLYEWIKNPQNYWEHTRMPNLRLSNQEAKDITAYLMSFVNEDFNELADLDIDQNELDNIDWNGQDYYGQQVNIDLSR